MKITIAGIGMGTKKTLTLGVLETLEGAELVIGAARLLDDLPQSYHGKKLVATKPQVIADMLAKHSNLAQVCVVMSGDSGFYSGAKHLLALLPDCAVVVLPGISSVQYMAAQLGFCWQDVRLVSAHGVDCNVVGNVLAASDSFFLTGGTVTPGVLAARLAAAGVPDITLWVGENLSYPNENMTSGTPSALSGKEFAPLAAVWVHRAPITTPHLFLTGGIPDHAFLRGAVPMTKQEVRVAALAKLGIAQGDVLYDIGAGTGSVAVEMALASPMVQVFAVEKNPEACDLIRQNRRCFGAYNITLIEGDAPTVLAKLPPPNAVFVGGSSGNLRGMIQAVVYKNPAVRVVVTAVTLETLAEAGSVLGSLGFLNIETTQLAVSRAVPMGSHHLLTAQNPVFIIRAQGICQKGD